MVREAILDEWKGQMYRPNDWIEGKIGIWAMRGYRIETK